MDEVTGVNIAELGNDEPENDGRRMENEGLEFAGLGNDGRVL